MSIICNLLSSTGYIMCNKSFARKYGVNTSIVLGELCSVFEVFKGNEFFLQMEKLEYSTALSAHQIRKAMSILEELGILSVKKKGIPAKNWYNIDEENLISVLSDCIKNDAKNENPNDNQTSENTDNSSSCEDIEDEDVKEFNSQSLKNLTTGDLKIERQLITNNNNYNNNYSLSEFDKSNSTDSRNQEYRSRSIPDFLSSERAKTPPKPRGGKPKENSSSFPKNCYDKCYTTYKTCFNNLLSNGKVSGNPYAPIKICNSRLKHWFEVFGTEKTVEGIENAAKDKFCVETLNFNLSKILSEGVFPDRVNNRVSASQPNFQKTSAISKLGKQDYSVGW